MNSPSFILYAIRVASGASVSGFNQSHALNIKIMLMKMTKNLIFLTKIIGSLSIIFI